MTTEDTEPKAEIVELTVEEVSLVDRAANKKTFLIVKEEAGPESAVAAVEEVKKDEELLEQSQELGQETSSEAGPDGAGESLGASEEQAGENREVVASEDPSEVFKRLEVRISDLPVIKNLVEQFEQLGKELADLRAEASTYRDIIKRVDQLLASPAEPVAKAVKAEAITPASNVDVLESKKNKKPDLLTYPGDLNAILRKKK